MPDDELGTRVATEAGIVYVRREDDGTVVLTQDVWSDGSRQVVRVAAKDVPAVTRRMLEGLEVQPR